MFDKVGVGSLAHHQETEDQLTGKCPGNPEFPVMLVIGGSAFVYVKVSFKVKGNRKGRDTRTQFCVITHDLSLHKQHRAHTRNDKHPFIEAILIKFMLLTLRILRHQVPRMYT